MLENIKSLYFLKHIFSNMIEKRALKIIKYNKSLQTKLDKALLNYRIISKHYIIYETKTKGKLYNAYTDKLIFEGEFLNGEKNGKGKEYFFEQIFEGEYLKGKRNGKFKEYNNKGKLIFEGEYLNGERNGKWKEYDYSGNVIMEREYLNGKLWNLKEYDKNNILINEINEGKGIITYFVNENLIFHCEYLNGERNGIFKVYDINGNVKLEEEYLNGNEDLYLKIKRYRILSFCVPPC